MAYQVDQKKVVLPDETEDIEIIDGKDYVTLLTCFPYGVNSHRLLVRGERTSNVPSELSVQMPVEQNNQEMMGTTYRADHSRSMRGALLHFPDLACVSDHQGKEEG